MSNVTTLHNTFFTGEITPKMAGLVTSPHYQMGVERMRNFIPMKLGGFRTRPGTRHIAVATNAACRLVPFTHTDGTMYVLELTNLECRIFTAAYAREVSGTTVVLTTPWTGAQVDEVQYAMVNGNMFLVHRSHAPRMITKSSGSWAISTPSFSGSRTFGGANAYPGVVAFYAGRLYLGSTNAEPHAIFASKIPTNTTGATNYTDFTMGTAAADAIYLLESDMNCKRIAWLANFGRLLSGTDRSVWMSDGNLPTPATFDMTITSRLGGAEIMAQALGNMLLYVGADGMSLRALVYSYEGGGYQDIDVSETADHLLKPGIIDMAVMTNPDPIAWLLLTDGTVVSATIRPIQGGVSAGFALHTFGGDGDCKALCVAQRTTRDEVWFVMDRTANTCIEYLYLDDVTTTAIEDQVILDNCYKGTLSPPSATVTGLTWLDTLDVDALGDGGVLPEKTVASDEVTYDRVLTDVVVGLAYESQVKTLRPELQINTTWQGKKKRVEKATWRMYRSYGGYVGQDENALEPMLFLTSGAYDYGDPQELFTGDKEAFLASAVDTEGQIILERRDPLPVIVLALMLRIAIMEV